MRVQRTLEADPDARPIAVILERNCPDMAATEEVMTLFEGRFTHLVTEASALPPGV